MIKYGEVESMKKYFPGQIVYTKGFWHNLAPNAPVEIINVRKVKKRPQFIVRDNSSNTSFPWTSYVKFRTKPR